MNYVAPGMLVAFLGTVILRRTFYTRARQRYLHERCRVGGFPLAAVFQPYNFFLAILSYILAMLSVECARIMLESNWLEPKRGYDISPFIRYLALLSPLFVACTFVITVVHMLKHLPKRRGFDDDLRWFPSFSHDLAMQVVALPLVYGICSFSNVCDILSVLATKSDEEIASNPSFKTNNQIADLYEAWALRCFGGACIALVHRQINLEAPTVQYIIDLVRKEVEHGLGENHPGFQHLNTQMRILKDPQKYLFQPLQMTVKTGMRFFIFTCAVRSLYLLAIGIFNIKEEDGGLSAAFFSLTKYVDGAMMLASTIAIYDLIAFEHFLKDILDKDQNDFKAFAKFFGVKAMVTLAFIQEYLLDLINKLFLTWSEAHIRLCYACLVCCEVFLLSIIVYLAWKPRDQLRQDGAQDDWYSGDRCGRDAPMGQLACEDDVQVSSLAPQDLLQLLNHDRWFEQHQGSEVQNRCSGILELRGNIGHTEGEALERLVNTLSTTCKAHFKPMFWFKFAADDAAGAAPRAPGGQGSRTSSSRQAPLLARAPSTELQQTAAFGGPPSAQSTPDVLRGGLGSFPLEAAPRSGMV